MMAAMRKTSRGAGEPGRRPDGNEGNRPTQSPSGREALWIGAGALALALIVRAAYLYDSADFPTFRLPIVDSLTYHKAAVGLARGEGISEKFFWRETMPFLRQIASSLPRVMPFMQYWPV